MSQLICELPLKTFYLASCPLHGEGSYVAIAWTQFHQDPKLQIVPFTRTSWEVKVTPSISSSSPLSSGAFGLQERLLSVQHLKQGGNLRN